MADFILLSEITGSIEQAENNIINSINNTVSNLDIINGKISDVFNTINTINIKAHQIKNGTERFVHSF